MTDLALEEPPLRLAVFGESIVSDWGNPAATTWRALLRALTAAGHDAAFLEPRRNRATVELLRARGAGALRAFAARYPDVRYRTYDLPRGVERSLWFGREVATLDAVVVLDTAPPEILDEVRAYRTHRLLRVLQRTGAGPGSPAVSSDEINLVLAPEEGDDGAVLFGAAVEVPAVRSAPARRGVVVVAYGDQSTAEATASALSSAEPDLLTSGGLPEPWAFVPEVELGERFGTAEVAVVVVAHQSPLAAARLALPLAAGCPVLAVGRDRPALPPDLPVPFVTVDTVAAEVARLRQSAVPAPLVPEPMRADLVAAGLIQSIHTARRTLRRQAGIPNT
jgi:hypothetical protein